MDRYLSLKMYELQETDEELQEDLEGAEEAAAREKVLLRSVDVSIVEGSVRIESVSPDSIETFTAELDEQLSNEFLIQTERLDIRKWNPLYYSSAYRSGADCSWELEYCGLKGGMIMHSGDGSYPKGWPVLLDLIDAFDSVQRPGQESVRIASDMAAEALEKKCGGSCLDIAGMVDMVSILSMMKMPQDVIACGILRSMMKEGALDAENAGKRFNKTVMDLLGEYGDESGLEPEEKRLALIEHAKASESMYFKRLVLAEVLSDLIAVKARLDRGEDFSDPVMGREEMGLYYAEMISVLDVLDNDQRAGVMYSKLVDLYKTVFVSYSLHSVNGVIYQVQGDTAGVMLKRGEYDWRPINEDIPEDAVPVTKELALFLAGLWRREADEILVRDGNKEGTHDVPDTTVLKVVMGRAPQGKARKDNKVALSILKRMITEDEQLLSAIRAGDFEMDLIENEEIEDVNQVPVSFLGLEDDESNMMAAVFTSMDEAGGIDCDDIEAVPVSMIFRFVKNMSRLDGIIIDPFSDRFVVSKEKIAEILDEIEKDQTVMI